MKFGRFFSQTSKQFWEIQMSKLIQKIESVLDRIEDNLMALFMAVSIALTFIQVVLRYIFNSPLFWAEEVVIYSIICMSFAGISYGIKHHSHIAVEVLSAFTPPKYERHLHVLQSIVGLIFALVLLYLGWKLVSITFARGQLSPALRIPIAWIYLAIPFAGASAVFRYALEIVRVNARFENPTDDEHLNMM